VKLACTGKQVTSPLATCHSLLLFPEYSGDSLLNYSVATNYVNFSPELLNCPLNSELSKLSPELPRILLTDVFDLPSRVLHAGVVLVKLIITVSFTLVIMGCGGGGGGGASAGAPNPPPAVSSPTISYETSQPLLDNSADQSLLVLLMGNSHARGVQSILQRLISIGQPNRTVQVQNAPGGGFLAERVGDGVSEQMLESRAWTHVVLQAQKYSSSGTVDYPTTAAGYWIRGSKSVGATAILFPEHPRRGNNTEGQTVYDLHYGIAQNENACVAPVGPVWDEALARDPNLVLHAEDGNHASAAGNFLTALVFYQIITGQMADTLPTISATGIDAGTQQLLGDTVTSVLFLYRPCNYEG
jgi:hypothetical protein